MTKEQIINIILAIIVSIVSAFSKSIFDKIFAEYKPDTKKIVSRIKTVFLIFFRYLLPIFGLLSLSFKKGGIDKFFVISFSFILFILVLNIFFDVLFNFYDKNYNKERELYKPTFDLVKDLVKTQKQTVILLEKNMKTSEEIINISTELIETVKTQKNNG